MRLCLSPGCSNIVVKGRCQACAAKHERGRPLLEVRRLYHTARWLALRVRVLLEDPLCVVCAAAGQDVAAAEVDHVVPHRGDLRLFWDRANLQGLCSACHSRKTRAGQ